MSFSIKSKILWYQIKDGYILYKLCINWRNSAIKFFKNFIIMHERIYINKNEIMQPNVPTKNQQIFLFKNEMIKMFGFSQITRNIVPSKLRFKHVNFNISSLIIVIIKILKIFNIFWINVDLKNCQYAKIITLFFLLDKNCVLSVKKWNIFYTELTIFRKSRNKNYYIPTFYRFMFLSPSHRRKGKILSAYFSRT